MSRSVDRAVEALIRERAIKGTQFLGCIKRGSACGKGRSAGGYDRAGVRLAMRGKAGWATSASGVVRLRDRTHVCVKLPPLAPSALGETNGNPHL